MKKILAVLLGLVAWMPMVGQSLPYAPPAMGGYWSTDGITWSFLTSTATTGGLAYTPPAAGLYGYNSSTGLWYPCSMTNPCAGAGGGGGGTPGGASFSVQYNNAGSFGGSTPCTGVGYFNTAAAPACATSANILASIGAAAIGNSSLTNPSTTVNGQTCTLGSACTIAAGIATPTTGDLLASTSVSGTVTTLHRVLAAVGIGDSYVYGYGVANAYRDGFFGQFVRDTHVPQFANYAVPGTVTQQIASSALNHVTYDPSLPTVYINDGGINDANLETCGASTGTNCQKNAQLAVEALVAWESIPPTYRIFASNATLSGTWNVGGNITLAPNPTGVSYGNAETSGSVGATATFSVPTSTSTKVGFTYEVNSAQAGTFTITVDGTLQTDFCSGTTTFSTQNCNGQAFFNGAGWAPFRQEFTVTPNTTHTVIITVLGNYVLPLSVDWIPPNTVTNINPVFYTNAPTNANAIAPTLAPYYNTAIATILNQEKADGLPVFLVDLVGGTPGANQTAQYATSNTALCLASVAAGHPNYCGHEAIEQTILNTEVTATSTAYPTGYQVSSYNSGSGATQSGQILSTLAINNGSPPTTSAWAAVSHEMNLGLYPTPTMTFYDAGANKFGIYGYLNDSSSGTPWAGSYGTLCSGSASYAWCLFSGLVGSTAVPGSFSTVGGINLSNGYTFFKGPDARLIGSVTAAATIAPTTFLTTLTGATTITTITPPSGWSSTYGGCLQFRAATGTTITFATGGNIETATTIVGPGKKEACWFGTTWDIE